MGWRATVVAVQAVPARDLKTAMARIRPDEPAGLWAGVVSEPAACNDRAKPFTRAKGRRPARHQDHTRESFRRAASGTAQAELVALWIGQDVPALVPLADVDLSRAKGEQPVELGLLVAVDGLDVQVQPVPGGLRSVRPNRKSISNGFLQPRSTRHSCRGSQPASPALRPRTARAARRPPRRRPGKRSGFPRARASTSWAQ